MEATNQGKFCINHPNSRGVAYCKRCNGYICRECIISVEGKNYCRKCYVDAQKEKANSKRCINHPDTLGIAYCNKCGGYLCQDCLITKSDKKYCKKCYEDLQAKELHERSYNEALKPPKASILSRSETSTPKGKCPFCAEEILVDAVKCRYCGEWLDHTMANNKSEQLAEPAIEQEEGFKKCPICGKITSDDIFECPLCKTGYSLEKGKNCPRCGQHNSLYNDLCISCRYRFQEENSEPINKPQQSNSNIPPGPTCPKCGSSAITAQKHGYGALKGLGTALVLGPVGLLGGFAGARKVDVVCIKCGKRWKI